MLTMTSEMAIELDLWRKRRAKRAAGTPVECLECGRKWRQRSLADPRCACGSVDIEIGE